MKICILGAGSWGIAIAKLLTCNDHEVTVWSIDPEEINMLKTTCEHKTKLPGVILPGCVEFTTDMKLALEGKKLVVIAVPSPFVRTTAAAAFPYIEDGTTIVSVAKGIEEETLMRLSEVIEQEIPQAKIAVLSGPSHAEEVGKSMPTTVVVGAKSKEVALMVQDAILKKSFIRRITN